MMQRALFLDRDGTLNEMVYDEDHGVLDSPRRPEQVRLMPGAAAFIHAGRALGYAIVIVTNQPGIAKGTMSLAQLDAVNLQLAKLLRAEGAAWDALYFCPHHPQGGPVPNPYVMPCDCRKPKPGMLLRAAREREIDLARSWMIGDGLNDIQAGRAAGCKTMLVANVKIEHIQALASKEQAYPDAYCANLFEAADYLRQQQQNETHAPR